MADKVCETCREVLRAANIRPNLGESYTEAIARLGVAEGLCCKEEILKPPRWLRPGYREEDDEELQELLRQRKRNQNL